MIRPFNKQTKSRMATILIISILLLVVIQLWPIGTKSRSSKKLQKGKPSSESKIDADNFVKQLDELGYFKYADKADVEALKSNFRKKFNSESELPTILDEKTLLPKDFRYYFCDGETIYEQGGIIQQIEELRPLFKKMNFRCEITDHIEDWEQNSGLNHRITVNGTEYVIFKNFEGYGWGEAPFRFCQIINKELDKQQINEQMYLINGGNDGRLAILSKEQYELMSKTYRDVEWRPLEIHEWAAYSKVDIRKFDYWKD